MTQEERYNKAFNETNKLKNKIELSVYEQEQNEISTALENLKKQINSLKSNKSRKKKSNIIENQKYRNRIIELDELLNEYSKDDLTSDVQEKINQINEEKTQITNWFNQLDNSNNDDTIQLFKLLYDQEDMSKKLMNINTIINKFHKNNPTIEDTINTNSTLEQLINTELTYYTDGFNEEDYNSIKQQFIDEQNVVDTMIELAEKNYRISKSNLDEIISEKNNIEANLSSVELKNLDNEIKNYERNENIWSKTLESIKALKINHTFVDDVVEEAINNALDSIVLEKQLPALSNETYDVQDVSNVEEQSQRVIPFLGESNEEEKSTDLVPEITPVDSDATVEDASTNVIPEITPVDSEATVEDASTNVIPEITPVDSEATVEDTSTNVIPEITPVDSDATVEDTSTNVIPEITPVDSEATVEDTSTNVIPEITPVDSDATVEDKSTNVISEITPVDGEVTVEDASTDVISEITPVDSEVTVEDTNTNVIPEINQDEIKTTEDSLGDSDEVKAEEVNNQTNNDNAFSSLSALFNQSIDNNASQNTDNGVIDNNINKYVRISEPRTHVLTNSEMNTLLRNCGLIINGSVIVEGNVNITINNYPLSQVSEKIEETEISDDQDIKLDSLIIDINNNQEIKDRINVVNTNSTYLIQGVSNNLIIPDDGLKEITGLSNKANDEISEILNNYSDLSDTIKSIISDSQKKTELVRFSLGNINDMNELKFLTKDDLVTLSKLNKDDYNSIIINLVGLMQYEKSLQHINDIIVNNNKEEVKTK